MTSLGLRNRNPGNIRPSASPWNGTIGENKGFVVFDTMENGIRALGKQLLRYYDSYKGADGSPIDTVDEAIDRWAPPSENDTEAYKVMVCTMLEVDRTTKLNFRDFDTLWWFAVAIGEQENGHQAFTDAVTDLQLDVGIGRALET
jgi:hypothetical protein